MEEASRPILNSESGNDRGPGEGGGYGEKGGCNRTVRLGKRVANGSAPRSRRRGMSFTDAVSRPRIKNTSVASGD